jgi:hypothetical protein
MPGSTPIWNGLVAPTAQAIGAIAPAMAEFKAGALDQLEYEGQIAAHNGDENGLMWAGIKHTAVDLLLPGSPQEGVLGMAAGAATGKALGYVAGALTRVAGDYSATRFLTNDIGGYVSDTVGPLRRSRTSSLDCWHARGC